MNRLSSFLLCCALLLTLAPSAQAQGELAFEKSFAPNLIALGGRSKISYTIQNTSDSEATALSFSDTLPAGLVIASPANGTNDCPGSILNAVAGTQEISVGGPGTLAAGASCTITVDVIGLTAGIHESTTGELSAILGQSTVNTDPATASLEILPPESLANVELTKTFGDAPIGPGGTGTLEFTITNHSDQPATNITFLDDLDAVVPGMEAINLPMQGGPIVDATFDGASGADLSIGDGSWDYLDRIENFNGANHDYPVDAAENPWNSPEFDPATSTVGPWDAGTPPLVAGEINAFPGTPATLFGVDAALNGENLVTTYLFRQTFTATAAHLAVTEWLAEHLIDDGAIIYLNGVEVFRTPNMPQGAVDTNTFAELGNEDTVAFSSINLRDALVIGENTLAVEVHQAAIDSSDVGFQLTLLPSSASPAAGFSYVDDAFGTNDAGFADGTTLAAGGFNGGALSVTVGGQTGFFNFDRRSSGGWTRTFTLSEPATVDVSFRYRMIYSAEYENNEFSQVLFEMDGVRFGTGPDNSLIRVAGDGNGGAPTDTGWRLANFELPLAAGSHTILLGVYNESSSSEEELTEVRFDSVQVSVPLTPTPICGPDSALSGSDVLTLTNGFLAPGESCTFSVDVTVPIDTPTDVYLNTTSRLGTNIGGTDLIGLPALAKLRVQPIPPAFKKEFTEDSLAIGEIGSITYTIDNSASALDATNLAFTETLPEGVSLAPQAPQTNCLGGTLQADLGVITYTGGSLEAGQVCTLTVPIVAVNAGDFTLTSSELQSDLGDSGTSSAPLNIAPPPLFTATLQPFSLTAGQPGTLTFTIDNQASGKDAENLTFAADLPAGVRIANPSGFSTDCQGGIASAVPGNDSLSYSGGRVPAGSSCTFVIDVVAAEGGAFEITSDALQSSLGDSGSASAEGEVDPLVNVTVEISKLQDPVLAGSGEGNVAWTITVTNHGPSTANEVIVGDSFPFQPGVTLSSTTPSVGTFAQGQWMVGTLAPGTQETLVIALTADASTAAGSDVLSNTATLLNVAEPNSAAAAETSASAQTSIARESDLAVSQVVSADSVVAGSGDNNLTLTVTVQNTGPSVATDVELLQTLDLPAGTTVASATASDGSFVVPTWTLDTLAAGSSATLTLNLTVSAGTVEGAEIASTSAIVASASTDPNQANNSSTVITGATNSVDLEITIDAAADTVRAAPGTAIYTVMVTNHGPSNAHGAQIANVLDLPDHVEIDTVEGISASAGTYVPGEEPGGLWTLDLPVGETELLTITLIVGTEAPNGESIVTTATLVEVNGTDTDDSNNGASASSEIVSGVDLVVTATRSADSVVAGSGELNLQYVFTITNNGPIDATKVLVDQMFALEPGITVASVTPSAGTFAEGRWTIPELQDGTSETLTVEFTVSASAPAGDEVLSVTASVADADQQQNTPGDEEITLTTPVRREVDLALTLSGSRNPVLAGFDLPGNLLHQLTVTNQGPSDASSLTIALQPQLPEGVTIDGVTTPPGSTFDSSNWSLALLPAGQSLTLDLTLSIPTNTPADAAGLTTQSSISSAAEPLLNEVDDQAELTTAIAHPANLTSLDTEITLDLQTGLLLQTVTVTNTNPVSLPAFRLLISGLPEGVTVRNSQGIENGKSVIVLNQELANQDSTQLVIEYFRANGEADFEPVIEFELLDRTQPVAQEPGAELDRILMLANGNVLLEFLSEPGSNYTIQYSSDGATWFDVQPSVTAGATRTQWIDNGPPKTPSPPGAGEDKSRFYRVRLNNNDQ